MLGQKEDDLESIYAYYKLCVKIDKRGESGNDMDEFEAHEVLEKHSNILTVKEMRHEMKGHLDVDMAKEKRVTLEEFLLFMYKQDWKEMINLRFEQGDPECKEIKEAEALLAAAQESLEDSKRKADVLRKNEERAKEAEAKAKGDEDRARQAESEAKNAESEAKRAEEAAKNTAEASRLELEKAKKDKICCFGEKKVKESDERRVAADNAAETAKSQRTQAEERRAQAEKKRAEAEKSRMEAAKLRAEAEASRKVAEEAVEKCGAAFEEAQNALEDLKTALKGAAQGRFWVMNKELEISKRYMSKKQLAAFEASREKRKTLKSLGLGKK